MLISAPMKATNAPALGVNSATPAPVSGAVILRPGRKPVTVTNLAWLLRNWQEVKALEFRCLGGKLRDGELRATLTDGGAYLTRYASIAVCAGFLDRPVFRGLTWRIVRHDLAEGVHPVREIVIGSAEHKAAVRAMFAGKGPDGYAAAVAAFLPSPAMREIGPVKVFAGAVIDLKVSGPAGNTDPAKVEFSANGHALTHAEAGDLARLAAGSQSMGAEIVRLTIGAVAASVVAPAPAVPFDVIAQRELGYPALSAPPAAGKGGAL